MKEIYDLAKSASKALRLMDNGETFMSSYVIDRLEKAALKNPSDQLIGNMRDVVKRVYANSEFVTQVELANIYDEMYGLSGGITAFRRDLGDLLPDKHAILETNKVSYSKNRSDMSEAISSENKDLKDLEEAFSSVFSLASGPTPGFYNNNIYRKAENVTRAQLRSIGYEPQNVRSINNNEHFILCVASYNTPEFNSIDIKIPVQTRNGAVLLPTKMIQEDSLVEITKENLYVGIKEGSWNKNNIARSKFAEERGRPQIGTPKAVIPSSLKEFANLENDLVVAASKFTSNEILLANKLISSELYAMGVPSPQVKVGSSNDNEITFFASIPTEIGRVSVEVPVEIHNGRPILPSSFSHAASNSRNTYDFSELGMGKFLRSIVGTQKIDGVQRDLGFVNNASYHELIDLIIEGAATKEYRTSEDALMSIQARFSPGEYIYALSKFSDLLKSSSNKDERDELVEQALKNGDLIIVSTSIEPYCPKLGLPLRKLSFDSKGRPIPLRRSNKADNLKESGAHISTSKIFLT